MTPCHDSQAALFGAPADTAEVTRTPARRTAPAAHDAALAGDCFGWLAALLPPPSPPVCGGCGQAMALPASAPVLWACPACHPQEVAA